KGTEIHRNAGKPMHDTFPLALLRSTNANHQDTASSPLFPAADTMPNLNANVSLFHEESRYLCFGRDPRLPARKQGPSVPNVVGRRRGRGRILKKKSSGPGRNPGLRFGSPTWMAQRRGSRIASISVATSDAPGIIGRGALVPFTPNTGRTPTT